MMIQTDLRRRSRRHRGSTTKIVLIVLCIVAAIGIVSCAGMALLVTVGYVRVQQSAQLNAAKTQIEMLESAIELYRLDLGELPSATSGLNALRSRPPEIPAQKWRGPYFNGEVPLDPWGNPYEYRLVPGTQAFEIVSLGPDGSLGTTDDIRSSSN